MIAESQDTNRLSRRRLLEQIGLASGGIAASTAILAPMTATRTAAQESTPANSGDAVHGGEIIYARPTDPPAIDPHSGNIAAHRVLVLVYDTLLTLDENGQISPGLAESWELENETSYLFHLRDNVTWQNGRKFEAEDVKANYERILDPEAGASRRGDLLIIDEMEVVDPLTLRIKLSSPNGGFPAFISDIYTAILPRELYEDGNPKLEAIGTGPFRLASWNPDNEMVLERFDEYWGADLPYLNRIRFQVVPEESSIVAGLRGGTIDHTTLENNQDYFLVEKEDLQVARSTRLGYEFLVINNGIPPFDNQQVRQAMAYAVNHEELLQAVLDGLGSLTGPLSPAMTKWALPVEEFDTYTQNLDKARSLLTEAGFPDGFSTELTVIPTFPTFVAAAQVIAAQLSQVGIQVTITPVEYGIWLDRLGKDGDMPLTINLTQGVGDPDPLLYGRFHSEGFNQANWNEPEVDALLEQGRKETDQGERKKIYDELQRMLADVKIPYIWLYSPDLIDVSQPSERGFRQHPTSMLYGFKETWIEEG